MVKFSYSSTYLEDPFSFSFSFSKVYRNLFIFCFSKVYKILLDLVLVKFTKSLVLVSVRFIKFFYF